MRFKIPFELIKEIDRGDCVLFVGSGLSVAAGLPNWRELLSPISQKIDCPPETDPLKIAQVYEFREGRRALTDYILEQTDTIGRKPHENLIRLAKLGVKTWITTNYDNFIEKALDAIGQPYIKVVRDNDLGLIRADRTVIIKLHGDREQKDTITITTKDFLTRSRRFPRLTEKIGQLLIEKTFLFVGYSITDPDFNQIHAQIAFDLEHFQRNCYALLFDVDEIAWQDLSCRNIRVIDLQSEAYENRSACLSDFLTQLGNHSVLSTNITKEVYYGFEAERIVPKWVLNDIEKQGFKLVKCIEYLIHYRITEEAQYVSHHPEWVPPEAEKDFPNHIIVPYQRTDVVGNIWQGFAIGGTGGENDQAE